MLGQRGAGAAGPRSGTLYGMTADDAELDRYFARERRKDKVQAYVGWGLMASVLLIPLLGVLWVVVDFVT